MGTLRIVIASPANWFYAWIAGTWQSPFYYINDFGWRQSEPARHQKLIDSGISIFIQQGRNILNVAPSPNLPSAKI